MLDIEYTAMQLTSRTLFSFVPFSVRSFFCFSLLFLNTHTDKKEANSSAMEAAALALYNAITSFVIAPTNEYGKQVEFTTEEEAIAFGHSITSAFASACEVTMNERKNAPFNSPLFLRSSQAALPSSVENAARTLYNAINPVVMDKFESGEFATEEEASAFGNSITAAFASACDDCGDDDFPEVFKAKLPSSKESFTTLARARSAILRAKLYGHQMARRLKQASEKASTEVVVPGKNSATKKSKVSLLLQAGKEEDIAMSVNLKVDVPTEEEKAAALGDGTEAQVAITISCKEGTSDIQLGKLVGRIQSLYDMATEHLPMVGAFGSLEIAPTELEDGRKGLVLTVSSPNNAVGMMVPQEALPMDPSSFLESLEATIGIGFCFEDLMSLDPEALLAKYFTVFTAQVEGVLNSDALLHAGEVVAAMAPSRENIAGGARLAANLCMANATLKFDSFAPFEKMVDQKFDIQDVKNVKSRLVVEKRLMKETLQGLFKHGYQKFNGSAYEGKKVEGDQIRGMYSDVQSVVSGIYKVEAITTLGFRVVMTLTNFNPIACLAPSLDEIGYGRMAADYAFPPELSADETEEMKEAWIGANVAFVKLLSDGTGTITVDTYVGPTPPMPMPQFLEMLGDGEKVTVMTMLKFWDQYIRGDWDGRLIPGQLRGILQMFLPDGTKLGVTFPAGGHYGQVSNKYDGPMDL